jgi:hypothetical protein
MVAPTLVVKMIGPWKMMIVEMIVVETFGLMKINQMMET